MTFKPSERIPERYDIAARAARYLSMRPLRPSGVVASTRHDSGRKSTSVASITEAIVWSCF